MMVFVVVVVVIVVVVGWLVVAVVCKLKRFDAGFDKMSSLFKEQSCTGYHVSLKRMREERGDGTPRPFICSAQGKWEGKEKGGLAQKKKTSRDQTSYS